MAPVPNLVRRRALDERRHEDQRRGDRFGLGGVGIMNGPTMDGSMEAGEMPGGQSALGRRSCHQTVRIRI